MSQPDMNVMDGESTTPGTDKQVAELLGQDREVLSGITAPPDFDELVPSQKEIAVVVLASTPFFSFFFNLTYSRWTSSLPSCLWSLRIFPFFPGSRLTIFYRDASSALLQLVNQWLNFTYSRSHAFRHERKNTNPTLVRIELTTSALEGVQITY